MTPEQGIKYQIGHYLRAQGAFIFQVDSVGIWDPTKQVYRKNRNPFRMPGVADLVGSIWGIPLAVEVKSKTGRLTVEQRWFLEEAGKRGWIAFCARSIEDVKAELAKWNSENINGRTANEGEK